MKTRCSPRRFVDCIEGFTNKQKSDVHEIGFGSLLKLRCVNLKRSICVNLLKMVDHMRYQINFGLKKNFWITASNIEAILGVADKGKPVVIKGNTEDLTELKSICGQDAKWEIPVELLERQIASSKEGGEHFKRDLLLFALTVLLCLSTSLNMSLKVLFSVVDVEHIKEYN